MKQGCYLVFLICSFFTSSHFAAVQSKPIICNQKYALCTSAPCIPDPRDPKYALCTCDVETGDSVGYKTCESRIPKQQQYKTTLIISTFSFKQFNSKKSLSCQKGNPWTDCVDAPCTVNPQDPNKAICSCKIHHEEAFFTFGGSCDLKTCATGFWSGATRSSGQQLRNALFKKLNIVKNPWHDISCTTTKLNSEEGKEP